MDRLTPSVTGTALKQASRSSIYDNNIKVLCVKDPDSPITRNLYYADKEDLFQGMFQDLDINETTFNTPNVDTSYHDIVPGTWKGLPDMTLLGEEYTGNWVIDYKRNSNKTENYTGTQIATSYTGKQFIRYGLNDVWQKWQLLNSIPFGMITAMLVPTANKNSNNMGWLPLNGYSHSIQKYPNLYAKIKTLVTTNATLNTFALPDLNNKYISASADQNGTFKDWTIPMLSDEIGILAGTTQTVKLFRDTAKRTGGLFQVERRDNTTIPYLSDTSVINPITGDSIKGDGSGLTNYLKLDFEEKVGTNHYSTKITPDTFFVSAFYIYAGYPQI